MGFVKVPKKNDIDKVLKELHGGPTRGHLSGDTTTHKSLCARYYWPTLFKDAHTHVRKCELCQKLRVMKRIQHFLYSRRK